MPVYRFELQTHLTAQAALARIGAVVGARRSFGGPPPFVGKVVGESFRLQRDISDRNAFLPVVWGRIISEPSGALVKVTMVLQPLVAIFMSVWLWGVGYGAWSFLSAPPSESHLMAVIPVALFVFGLALTCIGFFPEALTARRILEQAIAKSST
jgi:hypothetical protein